MATNMPEHVWIHVFSLTGHMTFSNFFSILSPVSDHNNEDSNGLYLTGGCEHRMIEQGSVTGQLSPVPVESGHWGLLGGGSPHRGFFGRESRLPEGTDAKRGEGTCLLRVFLSVPTSSGGVGLCCLFSPAESVPAPSASALFFL